MQHPNDLDIQIDNLRTLQQSYDRLASSVIDAPIVGELESGKAAIVAAINAMGGEADSSMSLGTLADAIRALILVQLGDLEYDIPIESCEEALNLASTHCIKYVNDYTTNMYTPLIVDEWQAVEEVRYKKLLKYDFDLFSSDERKSGVYALTLCHNLRKITFDLLSSIKISDNTSQFAANLNFLEEISLPSLTSITANNTPSRVQIFSGLLSLHTLYLPSLTTIAISDMINDYNDVKIFSELSSLQTLYLPSLTTIKVGVSNYGLRYNMFSGLSSLKTLSIPSLIEISGGSGQSYKMFNNAVNLEDIEIGHTDDFGVGSITYNMRLYGINPANTYGDAEKLAALNQSVKTKWFANLYDYTGGTSHTLTLAANFVSHLEQDTIDVATAKNWTIQTV